MQYETFWSCEYSPDSWDSWDDGFGRCWRFGLVGRAELHVTVLHITPFNVSESFLHTHSMQSASFELLIPQLKRVEMLHAHFFSFSFFFFAEANFKFAQEHLSILCSGPHVFLLLYSWRQKSEQLSHSSPIGLCCCIKTARVERGGKFNHIHIPPDAKRHIGAFFFSLFCLFQRSGTR